MVIEWNVTGGIPGKITHTEVHAVNTSDPLEKVILSQIYTGYTPESYESVIEAPTTTGTFRFHIHAVVDTTEVFTQEKTINVISPPNFEVLLSTKAISINQGNNRNINLTVTSIGTFNSTVTITLTALPSGVTATLDKTTVTSSPSGEVSANLQITVASNAAVGTYTLLVTGTSGSVTESDALAITVTSPYPPVYIEIRSYAYNPSTVVIRQGTTVTWTNMDPDIHSITNDFGAIYINPNKSWSYTFNQVGTFNYYDIDFSREMTGKIVVT